MRLYLVRHPVTLAYTDVCYGSADVPVSEDEREACLAKLLANTGLPVGLPLYSSPLSRCADFARRLAESWGVAPPQLDARLREMDFGQWEQREWARIPRSEVDAWVADLIGYRPGRGENVLEMAHRVLSFRDEIAAQGRDACVVCHAGTIRLLLAAQGRASVEEAALAAARSTLRIGHGELFVLPLSR
ncbi:MAG: phosphoglycerate mutase [Alcaligenaceae bacterium]|nr:phosphoglycerate mutase [Alcaligenaceae bacterium]